MTEMINIIIRIRLEEGKVHVAISGVASERTVENCITNKRGKTK